MSEKEAEEIFARYAPNWRQHLWQDDGLLSELVSNLVSLKAKDDKPGKRYAD